MKKFVELRQKIGTQEEFARLINSSKYCVSKWENGVSMPRTKELNKIASIMNISVDDLLRSLKK